MSDFCLNKPSKKVCETRSNFLLRLAKANVQETSINALEAPSTSANLRILYESNNDTVADTEENPCHSKNSSKIDEPKELTLNLSTSFNHSIEPFDSDDSVADRNYEPSSSEISEDEPAPTVQNETTEIKYKKLTRKKLRQPDTWEKNVKKIKRNLGEEYVNAAKKKIEKRKMKEPCKEKCRLKCFSKFTENQRKNIFETYWKMGSIDKQRNFIDKHVSKISPQYRNTKPGSKRSKNLKYTFQIGEQVIQVCKTFFKNTLNINNRTIFTTTKKKDEHGFLEADKRGKHGKQKRVKAEVINGIKRHIESFPKKRSHYCRERTKKEYLDGSLNIATMHRLYVEKCIENNEEYAKFSKYKNIFNTEYNTAFHVPKKDQCPLCVNYENGSKEDKEKIRDKYEKHLQEKELSRQEKHFDSQETDSVLVCCFDLQAVLTTPSGEISSFYYKRRLATYNFTLYNIKEELGTCFL